MFFYKKNSTTDKVLIDKDLCLKLSQLIGIENPSKAAEYLIQDYIQKKKIASENKGNNDTTLAKENRNEPLRYQLPTPPLPTKINTMTKTIAKSIFRQHGYHLSSCLTFASINKAQYVYWANPAPDYLDEDWTFILNNQHTEELILLQIPAGTFNLTDFYLKSGVIPNIMINPDTLQDVQGANFSPYIVTTIFYNE